MSPRVTASLAAILAVVVGYIVLIDRPQAQRAEEARHLVQMAAKDVTRITLTSSKGAVTLVRRDATHWDVASPPLGPAASYGVSSLLDSVTGLIPQQSLGADFRARQFASTNKLVRDHQGSGELFWNLGYQVKPATIGTMTPLTFAAVVAAATG